MRKNRKRAFTLIEVVVSLTLLVLIMSIAVGFLLPTLRLPNQAVDEYDIQGKLRLLSQKVNYTIRDASATFALYRINHNNLTAGWNYIIPSTDHTSIVEYLWNGSAHVAKVVAEPQAGVTYYLQFSKINPAYADNLLEYKVIATIDGETRELTSEVEALNSLQVIDRGNLTYPANTLAYRTDPRPTEISDVQASVTMVLDRSGSMDWTMGGGNTNTTSNKRIYKMKEEAKRLIQGLSSNPNIYASIVPFSSTANNPQAMLPVRVNDNANQVLINKIDSLTADGGTNTGDGLRRAYYIQKAFNDATTKTTKNFMIVLVDGVTTFFSATRWNSNGTILYVDGDNNIENNEINYYNQTYSNGRYAGNGSSLDANGTAYVNLMGSKIRTYGSGVTADKEPIQVYVIGFSGVPADHGSLQNIAQATTGNSTYYTAGDSEALEAIFAAISKDISDSLWHIGGPN
jgi:prepilin-type N-terminal cleavage/methylation domain-containing protein